MKDLTSEKKEEIEKIERNELCEESLEEMIAELRTIVNKRKPWWERSAEEIIEKIDTLVDKRNQLIYEYSRLEKSIEDAAQEKIDTLVDKSNQLIDEYYTLPESIEDAAQEKIIMRSLKKIKKIGKQVFEEMMPLSVLISDFHLYLYLLSRFIFITNEIMDWTLLEIEMPVIPAKYSCQSSIKKIFDKNEIQKLENIFFRGLKTFNEIVFFENHFIFSDGTYSFDKFWAEIKKNVESDIYKIVEEIGKILMAYYISNRETYEEIIDKMKKYINKNLSDYKSVDIDINEIGRDKTKYRVFQIKEDVNCGHGGNIYY